MGRELRHVTAAASRAFGHQEAEFGARKVDVHDVAEARGLGGRQHDQITEGCGLPLAVILTGGNRNDVAGFVVRRAGRAAGVRHPLGEQT